MMSWNCAFCVFSTILLHLLLTHINTRHNDQKDFFAFCGIDGCDRRFQKANSFARHVREKHVSYLYSNRHDVDLQTLQWLCDIKQNSVRKPVPLETDKFHRSTAAEGVGSSTTAKTVA